MTETVAILVGGGPAPGINGVISAATIRCLDEGWDVLGIEQGFKWIMQGDVSKVTPLALDQVSRLHFRGGSMFKTARANPTKNPAHLAQVLKSHDQLGVTGLITIGGDDTCFSALSLERAAQGACVSSTFPRPSITTWLFRKGSRPSDFKRPGTSEDPRPGYATGRGTNGGRGFGVLSDRAPLHGPIGQERFRGA